MNFTCDDNSIRSASAALNLTTLVQAQLSNDLQHQWVERAEIEKAASELKLSLFGQLNPAEVIQSGRWTMADWAITGSILVHEDKSRSLSLEVVDLHCADVLAETNIAILPPSDSPLVATPDEASNILSAVQSLLVVADRASVTNKQSVHVGVLFVAPLAASEWIAGLDEQVKLEISSGQPPAAPIHLIRFQRTDDAMSEGDIVLSGLAENEPDAWERVADQYIWVTYAAGKSMRPGDYFPAWPSEGKVELSLHIWDGKSEPHVINLSVTNGFSPKTIAQKVALAAAPYLIRNTTSLAADGVRHRVSQSLIENSLAMLGSDKNMVYGEISRRVWLSVSKQLETALFFDPGNALAQELWTRIRWDPSVADASRNEFIFDCGRSAAWGKFVKKFGFTSVAPKPPRPWWKSESVASAYVLSALKPFQMFDYADSNRRQWGMPMDIGGNDLMEWRNQLGAEFIARLLKIKDAPELASHTPEFLTHAIQVDNPSLAYQVIQKLWPQMVEESRVRQAVPLSHEDIVRLGQIFMQLGRPGQEIIYLKQLEVAANSKKNTAPPPVVVSTVHLPRLVEIESKETESAFAIGNLTFPPPLITPDVQTISFPTNITAKEITSMVFHDGILWFVVKVAEPVAPRTSTEHLEKNLQPVTTEQFRLWKFENNAKGPEAVTGPLSTNNFFSLMFRGDTMWLGLRDDGIAAWDTKTGQLHRYESTSGIQSVGQFSIAAAAHSMVAIGGVKDLSVLQDGTETWQPFTPPPPPQNFLLGGGLRCIAASRDKVVLYNSQLLACDLSSNAWTRVADYKQAKKLGRTTSIVSDKQGGFWLVTDMGLHFLDPSTLKMRNQWLPLSPSIVNQIPPGIGQGYRIFLKTKHQIATLIRHEINERRSILDDRELTNGNPNSFIPTSRLPGPVIAITREDEFLWVLTQQALLLYHPPTRSFVGGFALNNWGIVRAVTAANHQVWIATENLDVPRLNAVDSRPLTSLPRDRWVRDEISAPELATRLAALPDRQRVTYEFFTGNDNAALKLLETGDESVMTAESLFLLAMVRQELGQTNLATQSHAQLVERFPESAFTEVIERNQRLEEVRAKVKERLQKLSAAATGPRRAPGSHSPVEKLMGKYDVDDNGELDDVELTVLIETEPQWFLTAMFTIADDIDDRVSKVMRNDRNRDGKLQPEELATAVGDTGYLMSMGRPKKIPAPAPQKLPANQ